MSDFKCKTNFYLIEPFASVNNYRQ